MARVRTVREHQNLHGVAEGLGAAKGQGDEYELPDNLVPGLIAAGLVVLAGEAGQMAPEAIAEVEPKATAKAKPKPKRS